MFKLPIGREFRNHFVRNSLPKVRTIDFSVDYIKLTLC